MIPNRIVIYKAFTYCICRLIFEWMDSRNTLAGEVLAHIRASKALNMCICCLLIQYISQITCNDHVPVNINLHPFYVFDLTISFMPSSSFSWLVILLDCDRKESRVTDGHGESIAFTRNYCVAFRRGRVQDDDADRSNLVWSIVVVVIGRHQSIPNSNSRAISMFFSWTMVSTAWYIYILHKVVAQDSFSFIITVSSHLHLHLEY